MRAGVESPADFRILLPLLPLLPIPMRTAQYANSTVEDVDARMRRLRRVARLLDAQFRLPLTRFRFGFDSLAGLVPAGGDVATALLGLYIVNEARRMGVRPEILVRMLANLGLDMVVGLVPVAGDVADFFFKANLRNIQILEKELEQRWQNAKPVDGI